MPDITAPTPPGSLSAAVRRLADTLAAAATSEDIYAAALEGIGPALNVDRAAILIADAAGVMRFRASRGVSDEFRRSLDGHSPWAPGSPPPGPIVIRDITVDTSLARITAACAAENVRAVALVPVVSRRQTIGTLMLLWDGPYQLPAAGLDAALTLCTFLGLAVERAEQDAANREHERRLRAALGHEAEARERLTQLAEGAERLQISHDANTVMAEVIALAAKAVPADAYAVWRRYHDHWGIAASTGLDPEFAAVELRLEETNTYTEPLLAEDVHATPLLAARRAAYTAHGIKSIVAIPLQIRGRPSGSIVFYYRQTHRPSDLEVRVAQALGQLAAAAISSAELYAEQQSIRERAEFLSDVSARLTSLDYEQNLTTIANLIVPRFADWCVLDLLEGGELRQLAVAHADPERAEFMREMLRRYPPRRDTPGGPWQVVRTGQPLLYERIDAALLQGAARDTQHLSLLGDMGLRSAILVPLNRGNDVLGVISFARSAASRPYDKRDLEFAQELARRASYAIENARLYRQAQDANRAKDDFLAALSHELRTPLNAILGWASILRARPEAEVERGLDVIYRNAVVQTQLVEDLLDASRIVSGRMSIDLKDLPLRPILEAAIETILPQAADKAIELDVSYPNPKVLIRGDASRLQQVFWNVLSNAVKFTPRGGRIVIASEVAPEQVAVHITDTGAGIRPEALPFIFDRFKQADASTTRRYRGLGLGLTLSRQLTEMHGGRITATSAGPGLGSTFTVTLPIVEPTNIASRPTPPTYTSNALEGIHILAVDDDPDSLEVLISMLQSETATVVGAGSAVEALELVQKEQPHVVISDIAMPDRDGYWLMEQMRRMASEGGPNVPCIALTAFATASARERALATGFVAHLNKPFDPQQLIATVRSAAQR